ncbi:MAG: RNA polymerase sigma factor [Gemmatales bacterium]|nr:MAG: RNA polymerase sigma factor [Gemmatales bacterium]
MSDWDLIVRTHGQLVFGTAWRILGHVADTEDVVQEVFLEAYRMREKETVRNWGGFLRRMATFRALDRLRDRKPTVPLEGLRLVESGGDPEAEAVGKELRERLRQALGELPPREAAVFCLRYFEDLSNQEISDQLDISPGAVAQALHKARAKLEDRLENVLQGEES